MGFKSWAGGLLTGGGIGGMIGGLSGKNPLKGMFGGSYEKDPGGPWAGQQPYLTDMYSRAKTQVGKGGMPNQWQTGAMNQMKNYQNMFNPYSGMSNRYINRFNPNANKQNQFSNLWNPMSGVDNPYLNRTIEAASNDAMRGFMPAMNQANTQSGSFGNTGVAEAYSRAMGETLGNISNNARMDAYNRSADQWAQDAARNAMISGQDISRSADIWGQDIARNANLSGQDLSRNADIWNQDIGRNIDATTGMYNMGTNYGNIPWQNLINYSNIIGTPYAGKDPQYGNKTAETLGTVGQLAGIGKSIFGML